MKKTAMIFTAAMFLLLLFLIIESEGANDSNSQITSSVHWIEGRGGKVIEDWFFGLLTSMVSEGAYIKQITGAICLIIAWLLCSSRAYAMRKNIVIILLSFIGLYLLLSPIADVIRSDYTAGETYEENEVYSFAMNGDKQNNRSNQRKITEPPYEDGDVIGRLVIEKLNLDVPIVDGVLQQDLVDAVGHVGGTAYPNEGGNILIAGYRVIDSGPLFNNLTKLENNDRIEIMDYQETYLYEVTDSRMIEKDKMPDLLDDINEQLALLTNAGDGDGRLVVVIANKTE